MLAMDLTHVEKGSSDPDRNQVQLALAVANDDRLRSLLIDCAPAIAQPHQIGQVKVSVGTPPGTQGLESIDAVLEYEQVWCVLAEDAPQSNGRSSQDYQYLTRCQSELKTLAWRVNLSSAIALLQQGGFQEGHIQRILQLPWEGWHRSWWDTFDAKGQLGLPFQRWFRTRCYGDGTYTLQYRDHYPQDAPPCFRARWQQVPILSARSGDPFGHVLTCLRTARHALKAETCLLLADSLTNLEVEGYMRQGISLYPLQESALTDLTWHRREVPCDRAGLEALSLQHEA